MLKDVRFGGGDGDETEKYGRRQIRVRLLERKSPRIVEAFKEFGKTGVSGTFIGRKLFQRLARSITTEGQDRRTR